MGDVAAWWYYGLSAVMIITIGRLVWKKGQVEEELDQYKVALTDARQKRNKYRKERDEALARAEHAWLRVRDTEAGTSDIVTAVLPLVEKTDWMTGRWGGQFQTLVQLENARNRHVETLRQAISRLPAVAEMDPFEVLKGALPGAAQALADAAGVPEDQTLAFGREGGVQRVSRPTQNIAQDNSSDFGDDE